MPGRKNTIWTVLIIAAAWLLALSMAYLLYCKIRLLLH